MSPRARRPAENRELITRELDQTLIVEAAAGTGIEPQRAMTDAIAESVETNPSEAVFDVQSH